MLIFMAKDVVVVLLIKVVVLSINVTMVTRTTVVLVVKMLKFMAKKAMEEELEFH